MNAKKLVMPLFLLAIMVLSVVGLSYSPNSGTTQTGTAQQEFSYNGYDFEYVNSQGQTILTTTVDGERVMFNAPPQDVERLGLPSVDSIVEAGEVTLYVPGNASGQREYIAGVLQRGLEARGITVTTTSQRETMCEDTPGIALRSGGSKPLQKEQPGCYTTPVLDQTVFFITDYVGYTQYDIL
jgi:hypothetical protein